MNASAASPAGSSSAAGAKTKKNRSVNFGGGESVTVILDDRMGVHEGPTDSDEEKLKARPFVQQLRHFDFSVGQLSFHQDYFANEGTGAVVWDSEVAISRFLDMWGETGGLRGKLVVELGAGLAMACFIAAAHGATTVGTNRTTPCLSSSPTAYLKRTLWKLCSKPSRTSPPARKKREAKSSYCPVSKPGPKLKRPLFSMACVICP